MLLPKFCVFSRGVSVFSAEMLSVSAFSELLSLLLSEKIGEIASIISDRREPLSPSFVLSEIFEILDSTSGF